MFLKFNKSHTFFCQKIYGSRLVQYWSQQHEKQLKVLMYREGLSCCKKEVSVLTGLNETIIKIGWFSHHTTLATEIRLLQRHLSLSNHISSVVEGNNHCCWAQKTTMLVVNRKSPLHLFYCSERLSPCPSQKSLWSRCWLAAGEARVCLHFPMNVIVLPWDAQQYHCYIDT